MNPGAESPKKNFRFCFSTETILYNFLCYFFVRLHETIFSVSAKLSTDLRSSRLLFFLLKLKGERLPVSVEAVRERALANLIPISNVISLHQNGLWFFPS